MTIIDGFGVNRTTYEVAGSTLIDCDNRYHLREFASEKHLKTWIAERFKKGLLIIK